MFWSRSNHLREEYKTKIINDTFSFIEDATFKITRTPENVERLRKAVLKSFKRYARKYEAAPSISDSTERRILPKDLKFDRHKLALVKNLNQAILLHENGHVKPASFFHLLGNVNKQNLWCWGGMNPRQLHELPLYVERVTVWFAGLFDHGFLKRPIAQIQWCLGVMSTWLRIFFFLRN